MGIPEPWSGRAENLGLPASYQGLARETGLGVETVRQAILGTLGRRPSARTIRELARVLREEPAVIDEWCGYKTLGDLTPYVPPEEAARLTPKQRKAVNAMILAMVEPDERNRRT